MKLTNKILDVLVRSITTKVNDAVKAHNTEVLKQDITTPEILEYLKLEESNKKLQDKINKNNKKQDTIIKTLKFSIETSYRSPSAIQQIKQWEFKDQLKKEVYSNQIEDAVVLNANKDMETIIEEVSKQFM